MTHEANFSIHQENLVDTLGMAAKLGYNPDTVIIGVEPEEITWSTELSPSVKSKIPRIIELVYRELS